MARAVDDGGKQPENPSHDLIEQKVNANLNAIRISLMLRVCAPNCDRNRIQCAPLNLYRITMMNLFGCSFFASSLR